MTSTALQYEFDEIPESGGTFEVAQQLHWLRMPLPFELDHINLWLLEDGDGWTIVDTGIGSDGNKDVWRQTFTGTMQDRPASRVIATHLHPDHAGCAGWLTRQFDIELWMTREEYMLCRLLVADTGRPPPEEGLHFYKAAGFPPDALKWYRQIFGFFGKLVSRLPEAYVRIHGGDRLKIGDRSWEVLIGRGHSPEHACLYNESLNVLISGDQILPGISSNVSVYPTEPEANPLRHWIESLSEIRARVPEDVLVLPAHGRPFRGIHRRIDQLIEGHHMQLERLADFCKEARRAIDVFPALYRRKIPDDQLIMAVGEAIAHLHYLMAQDAIVTETDKDGVIWYRRS